MGEEAKELAKNTEDEEIKEIVHEYYDLSSKAVNRDELTDCNVCRAISSCKPRRLKTVIGSWCLTIHPFIRRAEGR